MSQNGQTHFKNLAVFAGQMQSVSIYFVACAKLPLKWIIHAEYIEALIVIANCYFI